MSSNKNLSKAKVAKNDEFYTQLEDIEAEISSHQDYVKAFQGKVVYCNCDDPDKSNFCKFFILHFKQLGLKKLITTHYTGSNVLFLDQSPAHKLEFYGEYADNGEPITHKTPLSCNGDFRSDECVELLKESDIVVTNPPFSLFREFVAQLMEYGKQFVIIGNQNAVTYKEIFPLIRDNKLWYGHSIHSGDRMFYVPEDYPLNAAGCGTDSEGHRFIRVKGVRWFTNIELNQRHETLPLVKNYIGNESSYPKYDNYAAVEVGETKNIPKDYFGIMGVPITFMDKYCPDQFEILTIMTGAKGDGLVNGDDGRAKFYVNGEGVYARILIRRKEN